MKRDGKTITLAEVAQKAGVSVATASRVVSNSTYSVRDDLRERVLSAAEELKYVPNAHARALVRKETSTIGVIVGDVSDPYFAEIVRGIQRTAGESNRLVIVCNSYREPEQELAYMRLLRAQDVEGIVLAGSGICDHDYNRELGAEVEAFAVSGGRVSFIGRHHVAGDAVLPDNASGAKALGQKLVNLGHRNFGIISGPPNLATSCDRLEGFQRALNEAGIALHPERIIDGDFSRDSGAEAAVHLLKRFPQITAIFALNDIMAVGALSALRQRGVSVPHDVSLAGFDDIPIARDVTPTLSTVRLPMMQMGVRALEFVLEDHGSELQVEHLPTKVVMRESTAQV